MAVQAHKPEMLELIAEDAELERLGLGFTFTEGPLWHPDGYLLFSDMPGDVRRRWDEESGVTDVANPSNNGTGSGREALATHYDGRELNSPNDVIVKSDGSIYFTDPTYGRMPGFGLEREQELDFQGVYRLPAGGGELELVVDDFAQPNGLCFTADESLLYINDTDRAHIRVFEVGSDGSLSGGDVLADGIGTGELESGELVDGMKLDEPGNIWVTGPKGVWVFSPDGEHLGVLEVPENVGNVNWGGPARNWLFIPASTSMFRVQTKVSGNRLPYMR